MRRAVITTTIYRPDNLLDWGRHMRRGDIMVVAGDIGTPHDEVREVLSFVSDMADVATLYTVTNDTRTSRVVPMRSIQRRNVAVLEAVRLGADMITTVDTDNFPLADHRQNVGFGHLDSIEELLTKPWRGDLIGSSSGWANAGEWCDPPVLHRGWPLGIPSDPVLHSHSLDDIMIGVHASLWLGDPDITALERLLDDPTVTGVPDDCVALEPGVWCPFNSQATTFRRELFPLLNVWPGVDRMDDIWPSYVARHIMDHLGYLVAYGAPNVKQLRHPHDVVTDLEKEIIGYRHTGVFLDVLSAIDLAGVDNALDCLEEVLTALDASRQLTDVIPDVTRKFWKAWVADLRDIAVEEINQ